MSNSQIKLLLFLAIIIVCVVPLAAAFYFVDDALQRSLNLGFNAQIVHELDLGAQDLKTLKTFDPAHESLYRARFDEIQDLKQIYEEPKVVKGCGKRVSLLDLPEDILAGAESAESRSGGSALREYRDKSEREFILATLKRNVGNISHSALELGVGRSYLHRRLAVLGITKKDWFS